MRYREVTLDIPKERWEEIEKQLEDQKALLSLPDRITARDYITEHLLPLGLAEAEKRINRARAPHIVSPYD